MEDLEQTPLDAVVDYVGSLKLKPNGKKLVIKILSAFWNYYTVTSFTIEKQAPHFYRNVMNEWEVVYGVYYSFLTKQTKGKYRLYRKLQSSRNP